MLVVGKVAVTLTPDPCLYSPTGGAIYVPVPAGDPVVVSGNTSITSRGPPLV